MSEDWVEGHSLGRSFEEARMTETLLGAAMRQTEVIEELIACGFGEDDLDNRNHRSIWVIAKELHQKNIAPQAAIVEAKLIHNGVPEDTARDFINGCMRSGVEVAHPKLASFVQYIRNKVALRRLGEVGKRTIAEAGNDNATPSIIAASVNAEIDRILMGAATADGADAKEIQQIIADARNKRQGKSKEFYSLGHPVLDQYLHGGGMQGTTILISAEIGVGKSTNARTIVRNLVAKGISTLLFSFEMNREEIALCLQQTISGVTIDDSVLTSREHASIIQAEEEISNWPLFIEDRQMVTVEDVTTRIHQYVKRYGVKAVVIDYVQDIEFSTRFQRVDMNYGHISKTLRRCVDSLQILMIQMAQQKGQEEGPSNKIVKKSADDIVADSRQFMKDCHAHISLKRNKTNEAVANITKLELTKNRRFGTIGTAYSTYDKKTGLMVPSNERGEPMDSQVRIHMNELKPKQILNDYVLEDDVDELFR